MSLNVVSFRRAAPLCRDWTSQELAEFYRVEAALTGGGISVETERGLSDDGDPWFVFCRQDSGDVIIHFARIDDEYVVAGPCFDVCARARDFRALVKSLVDSYPLVLKRPKEAGNVVIHPAALLVLLVTTCFFMLRHSDASAAELNHAGHSAPSSAADSSSSTSPSSSSSTSSSSAGAFDSGARTAPQDDDRKLVLDEQASTSVLAAVAAAIAFAELGLSPLQNAPLSDAHWAPPSTETPGKWELAVTNAVDSVRHDHSSGAHSSGPKPSDFSHQHENGATGAQFLNLTTPDAKAQNPNQVFTENPSSGAAPVSAAIVSSGPNQQPALSHAASPVAAIDHFLQINAGAQSLTALSVAFQSAGLTLGTTLLTHLVQAPDPEKVAELTEASHSLSAGASQDASSPLPASSDSTSSSSTTPSVTPASVPGPSSSSAPPTASANLQAAETAIQQFMTVHPDFQVIVSGAETIIYDQHLTYANLPATTEQTFTFSDGSSVVLIGLPASQAHTLAAGLAN